MWSNLGSAMTGFHPNFLTVSAWQTSKHLEKYSKNNDFGKIYLGYFLQLVLFSTTHKVSDRKGVGGGLIKHDMKFLSIFIFIWQGIACPLGVLNRFILVLINKKFENINFFCERYKPVQ